MRVVVGQSVARVLAGFLASAAVAGAFVCAVAVTQPGAGPAPRWPGSDAAPARSSLRLPAPVPQADVVRAAIALRAPVAAARPSAAPVRSRAARPVSAAPQQSSALPKTPGPRLPALPQAELPAIPSVPAPEVPTPTPAPATQR